MCSSSSPIGEGGKSLEPLNVEPAGGFAFLMSKPIRGGSEDRLAGVDHESEHIFRAASEEVERR